jgi:hypothetical protein
MYKIRNPEGKWSNGKTAVPGLLWKTKGGKTWSSKAGIVGHLAYIAKLSRSDRGHWRGCVVVEFSDSGELPIEHNMREWVEIYINRNKAKAEEERKARIKRELDEARTNLRRAKSRLKGAERAYEKEFGQVPQ